MPMKSDVEISIVILNYNGIFHTRELLFSVKEKLKDVSYEVIVVDNGSKNKEYEQLKTEFPEYKILDSGKNRGFAGGNNFGIKECLSDYVMLLNNDTLLTESSIKWLLNRLKEHPEIAAVSPKIHFYSPQGTIQYAGFSQLSSITLRNKAIGFGEADMGQYEISHETASTHGAAMMVSREVINKVGLMSELYFLYYEELDWCEMMRKAGYEIWYEPRSLVIHKESQSSGVNSPLKKYYLVRNRLLFASRNRNGLIKLLAITYQLTVVLIKELLSSLIERRFDLVKATFSGVKDFFLMRINKKQ